MWCLRKHHIIMLLLLFVFLVLFVWYWMFSGKKALKSSKRKQRKPDRIPANLSVVSPPACSKEIIRSPAACVHHHTPHGVRIDEVLDATVTCNGTWSKCGFTASWSRFRGRLSKCWTKPSSPSAARDAWSKLSTKSQLSVQAVGGSPCNLCLQACVDVLHLELH